ncbi:MAG: hypothetical protein DRJ03_26935 [Chloroflexi bacterium]|nr:MAG: hypothetical protein DRJ03_26935 [Chloroflexota bacterium]
MASNYILSLLAATTKVVVWFWAIFILLPRQILPAPKRGENRLWADVVRMGFYTIIIVHFLVLIGIYDLFSLIASYVLLYFLFLFLRPEGLSRTGMENLFTQFMVFALDALERKANYGELARRRWDEFKAWARGRLPDRDKALWGIGLLWVLVASGYLRLYEALNAAALTPTFYSHLKWLKGLIRGELYVDGIYPYGAFTLLSGLKLFTFLDEAELLRAAQGLAGVLTAAGVYFAVRYFSGRRDAALLGSSLYGIFTFARVFPGQPFYPNEALPVELALAFLLPTWVFVARYLAERELVWLGLAFQGTVTVFLIHPFVGAAALAGWALALPAGLIYGRWRGQGVLWMFLSALGAVVLGNVFYVVGGLGGKVWVEGALALPAQMWEHWIADATNLPRALASETPWFLIALFVTPLLLFPGGDDDELRSPHSTRTGRFTLALALFGVAILIGGSQQLGWSDLLASRLMAATLSLLACAGLGVAYGMIASWMAALVRRGKFPIPNPQSPIWSLGAVILVLVVLLVISPGLVVKEAAKAEYDIVALKIYDIKEEHLAYTWTIVGAPEVLPHTLGRGWYLNGDYFLQNYLPEVYHYDPDEPELSVPTEHVYIVVEKNIYAAPYTAKHLYQREAMEQGLWDWCRTYGQSHDNVTVYYEDDDIVIYHIHHPLVPAEPGKDERGASRIWMEITR